MAEQASHEFRRAEKLDKRAALDAVDAYHKSREAAEAKADAERLLNPPKHLVGDRTTELVPAPEPGAKVPNVRLNFVDTLAEPNTISVDASEHRASVATRAGVLSAALDASVSAGAKNSIERMLCHQLAAVHMAGMGAAHQVQEAPILGRAQPADLARFQGGSTMWREDSTRHALSGAGDAERAVSDVRWVEHGTENARGTGTESTHAMEARLAFASENSLRRIVDDGEPCAHCPTNSETRSRNRVGRRLHIESCSPL